ncbi:MULTISPECIES: HD domain-containing protein [unclassified Methylophaga]|jgi:putative hydrolase of HD superfamily|uniref:HD domain-containing protein n=2 Tax=Methylophaga TaxID=40222 RepID=UPI000C4EB94C|nr:MULTISPECIES: HD domain-containing protein [unclassified Methylophaga]MAL50354.1 phosphohydrolase [Methylophaga sp.]MBP25703.1 phosphohydrolase [Methylophaga sp.]|tara:strand:+ start:4946 stop:5548 length:603 start_codon:yes stop_codon:yes gene_type:complete
MLSENKTTANLNSITDFFLELDALKHVQRQSYISVGERRENSAEHSWHLAMACWSIANHFKLQLNMETLLKLALVHDLGEIDAGDTFLYAKDRSAAHHAERSCLQRLSDHPGNSINDLSDLWEEQELGDSREAMLLKVVDRLLPFLLNINNDGRPWKEHSVRKSQVAGAHAFIEELFPEIHQWITDNIERAVAKGWLVND